jgi:hypothetical protein
VTTKRVALRSRSGLPATNGRYLRAVDGGGSAVRADREHIGPDEVFELTIADDGSTTLQTRTGRYLSAQPDGSLVADRTDGGPWETFVPTKRLTPGGGGAQLRGRLRAVGRLFVAGDGGIFRPVFASALTALAPNKPVAPFFDWCRGIGFNGVRIFGGALSWAGQTAEDARTRLPLTLAMAADRGLYVELTCLTDTGALPFDKMVHLREIAAIVREFPNVIIEIANEFEHATQDSQVHDANWLRSQVGLFAAGGHPVAIGAPEADEPDPSGRWGGTGGHYGTAHLDRGRDKWNQCRRVREIEACSAAGRFPLINNEPIGAAEPGTPGQRRNDPDFFYTLGALNRLFEVGGVFHFQDGLHTTVPVGPVQQQCAEAFVRGSCAMQALNARLTYLNVGHAGSPLAGATFNEGKPTPGVTRAYSGISGNMGFTVLVGLVGDPGLKWANGWAPTGTVDELGGARVLSIKQG